MTAYFKKHAIKRDSTKKHPKITQYAANTGPTSTVVVQTLI
jgi:hypothetical protein